MLLPSTQLSNYPKPTIPTFPFPKRFHGEIAGKKCKFGLAGVALQRRTFTNKSNLHQNFIYLVLLLLCGFCAHSHRRNRMSGMGGVRNGESKEGERLQKTRTEQQHKSEIAFGQLQNQE